MTWSDIREKWDSMNDPLKSFIIASGLFVLFWTCMILTVVVPGFILILFLAGMLLVFWVIVRFLMFMFK